MLRHITGLLISQSKRIKPIKVPVSCWYGRIITHVQKKKMTDFKEEQNNEIEAIESIYPEEIEG